MGGYKFVWEFDASVTVDSRGRVAPMNHDRSIALRSGSECSKRIFQKVHFFLCYVRCDVNSSYDCQIQISSFQKQSELNDNVKDVQEVQGY